MPKQVKKVKKEVPESLPVLHIIEEKELPPMVGVTFGMTDEDHHKLLVMAVEDFSQEEIDNLIVGEFIRRGIIETSERMLAEEALIEAEKKVKKPRAAKKGKRK